jgi:hypothetical protein
MNEQQYFPDQEDDGFHCEESHPADYGYGGFESWEDFHNQCDAMEEKCEDWE